MSYEMPRSDKTASREPELPGEADNRSLESMAEGYTDAAADMEDNELHVTGKKCAVCHQDIGPGEDVLRRLDGTYRHESCP